MEDHRCFGPHLCAFFDNELGVSHDYPVHPASVRFRLNSVYVPVVTVSTISHASTAEQQRLCSSDAFRLCSSEIPNVDRVTICMRKHKASLSDGCKAVFDRPKPSSSTQ